MLVETHDRKLRILLTGTEVDSLFGGYDGINYKDPTARHILNQLISRAFGQTDFLKNTDQLTIEVHPHAGGCAIDLTKRSKQPKRLYPAIKCALRFSDIEEMIETILYIEKTSSGCKAKSSLYKTQNHYYLLAILPHSKLNRLRRRYDIISDKKVIAVIEEYGKNICPENAVERIGKAFG